MMRLAKAIRRIYSPSGKGLGEKGFTLIELLVVIGILAVLAGVVTLSVGRFIGRGADEAAATELHNVQTAVVAYMADNAGAIPTSGDFTVLVPDYLLEAPDGTHGTYTWDANGVVTQTPAP